LSSVQAIAGILLRYWRRGDDARGVNDIHDGELLELAAACILYKLYNRQMDGNILLFLLLVLPEH
jgi:hypothetical protein